MRRFLRLFWAPKNLSALRALPLQCRASASWPCAADGFAAASRLSAILQPFTIAAAPDRLVCAMAWTTLVLCALLTPAGAFSPHLASSRARRPRTARSASLSALPRGKAAAIAGAAYGLYSWVVLRRLAPRYAAMRCLAAINAPTPNATEIAELAEALPPAPAPEPADEAWEQLLSLIHI